MKLIAIISLILLDISCICSVWDSSGFPCGHVIAVILHCKEDPQQYVESFFIIAAFKKMYEMSIMPLDLSNINGGAIHSPSIVLSNPDHERSDNANSDYDVLPLSTEEHIKRIFKCSRCQGTEHSKRTYSTPI